jgi:hypothetical protein
MYSNSKANKSFPDPLLPSEKKQDKRYGMKYAKAIEAQWRGSSDKNSLQKRRRKVFQRNRKYSLGIQDTSIYKRLLNNVDPNSGDGSLMNLDYTPVPILPKFVRIVVNKILSKNPYPNLEAIDPFSSSEKNNYKRRVKNQVELRDELKKLKDTTGGLVLGDDPDKLPETMEEAEIYLDSNVKTDGEISAQIATNLTLSWNNFNDGIFRRCVNDIVALGMSVVKRSNDPNVGIRVEYVDPEKFVHSYTEDPSFDDLVYAGHIKTITISELKRMAGDQLSEEDYEKISQKSKGTGVSGNSTQYDDLGDRTMYEYDEYTIDILEFEFLSVDTMFFEEKENKFGNSNFYYQGFAQKGGKDSVFEASPEKLQIECIYGGVYIMGTDHVINYGKQTNMPRNIHDLSRAKLSYSVVSTNINRMMPKSMVDSCVGFADMLQLTHLKIQQAIAKAKPDGLIIDIEGLENVQLGKGGELQPLDLHDIYEQTGVFYYRSKNPDGTGQAPPIREIGNAIRNINELIALYNHYMRLIRDTTGINEAMDASSPKGDALVGVRQQAIAAGNNAIYDITNASMILYKKVCSDVVKCLQIIPDGSVISRAYENAIGKENMEALTSFKDLPMFNFGVQVVKEMETEDKQYLEQSIQVALGQKEIDLEDALIVRNIKDVNQAERLLMVKRKNRQKDQAKIAQQNSQQQAQVAQQAAQSASQAKQQELQTEAQLEMQKIQAKTQAEMELEKLKHEHRREIEMIRAQATLGFRTEDQEFREKLETMKEEGKESRVDQQASLTSKLIAQRQGQGGEFDTTDENIENSL